MSHEQFPQRIKRSTTRVPATALKALNSSPYELVAFPASGNVYNLLSVTMVFTPGSEVLVDPGAAMIRIAVTPSFRITEQVAVTGFLTSATIRYLSLLPISQAVTGLSLSEPGFSLNMNVGDMTGNVSDDAFLDVVLHYIEGPVR